MTSSEHNPFLISPPPGLIPAQKPAAEAVPEKVVDPGDLIGLPPGIAESVTHRVSPAVTPAPAAAAPSAPTVVPPEAAAQTTETPVVPVTAGPSRPALLLPHGERVELSATVLLGRDPAASGTWAGAALVPVSDPDKSVSKTHAAVTVGDGGIRIHDLNSTNGTAVIRSDGGVESVESGSSLPVHPGDTISLGQFSILLAV